MEGIYRFSATYEGAHLTGIFVEESALVDELCNFNQELYFGEYVGHPEGISFKVKKSYFEKLDCPVEVAQYFATAQMNTGVNPVQIYKDGLEDGLYY